MAEAVDLDYSDLDELGLDSDELSDNFLKAAKHLTSLVSQLDDKTLLLLYGYYKQATEGPCNIDPPSWYNTKGKAKWEAWHKLGNMPSDEAKLLYIQNIENIDGNFSNTSSKDTWVRISTMQISEDHLSESEKNLTDFVKEDQHHKVLEVLKSFSSADIKEKLNQLDDEGLGLIHWAADRGYSDLLKTLIQYGADVDLVDSDDQTALHYAASCGNAECIHTLVNSGASVSRKDSSGLMPEEVACDANIQNIFKMLKMS